MKSKDKESIRDYSFQYKRKNTIQNTCSSCDHFFDHKRHDQIGFCKKWNETQRRLDKCNRFVQFESPFESYDPNPFEDLSPTYFQHLKLDF